MSTRIEFCTKQIRRMLINTVLMLYYIYTCIFIYSAIVICMLKESTGYSSIYTHTTLLTHHIHYITLNTHQYTLIQHFLASSWLSLKRLAACLLLKRQGSRVGVAATK
jgi:hypothetical protein